MIVITASGSPLAQMAQSHGQIVLAADHPEDFDRYSPMVSRLLHLLIIDILTTGVALRLGPGLRPLMQEIKRNLRSKRYLQAEPGATRLIEHRQRPRGTHRVSPGRHWTRTCCARRAGQAGAAAGCRPSRPSTPYSRARSASLAGAPCTDRGVPRAWAARRHSSSTATAEVSSACRADASTTGAVPVGTAASACCATGPASGAGFADGQARRQGDGGHVGKGL